MARSRVDPAVAAHLEWLGFVGPKGLVVSAPALASAGAILERNDAEGQRLLLSCLAGAGGEPGPPADDSEPRFADFPTFAESVLEWSFTPKYYAGTEAQPIPPELTLPLPDHGETLRPDFAVRELEPDDGDSSWQLLVTVLDGDDFDHPTAGPGRLEMSPLGRMERLLRATRVPAGLIANGHALRLVSAPYGESSGWLDFRVADMVQTAGRPIAAAMRLLLREPRLLTMARPKRLSALLADSRRYQNDVSERLAEQVLHALYELLRGFQAAHDASGRELLRQPLTEHSDQVYHALLTVVLRLVFLLYAEERDLLPGDETFGRSYSLAGLYERLREDAAHYPDTMDQRYVAWAQLVALFRMIHDGARAAGLDLPRRHGVLFDPDRFPFLEGRAGGGARQLHLSIEPPRVPDGTVFRALDKLLVLDGERISYRALDVEQIGSVYETMMGFRLETASGRALAVRAQKKHGAPTAVDLDALLAEPPGRRVKRLQDRTGRKPTAKVAKAVRAAATLDELDAALGKLIDRAATPDFVPPGAMVLQPSEERRRSGSHYTPRSLTEPIVRTTLEPILARLRDDDGRPPRPERILDLKVLDPAMGSGAFLVETCRQLGEALVEAWAVHDETPEIPPDEDERVHAMRLVAQRCLYGVDRNPVAVDLAKVSLWLATLAKAHPLTFIDHALRHGDSLVGLSRQQFEAFHWDGSRDPVLRGFGLRESIDRVRELREEIRGAGEEVTLDDPLPDLWDRADHELGEVRLYGDLVIAAFFDGSKPKDREAKLPVYLEEVRAGKAGERRGWLAERRHADPPLAPFHWEVEFPEVFERENPGFDAVVGNPPFLGGKRISTTLGEEYRDWLAELHEEVSSNADLVAHFYRRAFGLIREHGTFGLIATNTISQGDTRSSGLGWIRRHGGEIYSVQKRLPWPGLAAVVVSVVHVARGDVDRRKTLDDREVSRITPFLFHRGGDEDPVRLAANSGMSFNGMFLRGMGFTFDGTDREGKTTPLAEMRQLIEKDGRNQEVIFPYIGGEEVNSSPTYDSLRYTINFGALGEEECRRRWPDLMAIVEAKVRPERMLVTRKPHRIRWWQYAEKRPELVDSIAGLERVLVTTLHAQHYSIRSWPSGAVFSHGLAVFATGSNAAFCALQARPHETWARFFGSSLGDALRYTPSDCFETFPFPENWETHPALEAAGCAYYDFRAALMIENDEGLTKTYNRFHDPDERDPDILKLRELHAAMDRAVLDAYGWTDVPTDCEFLLDYEIGDDEWSPRKKKPWRYRWPDEVRDDVLARLLELNADRAREEARSGAAAEVHRGAKRARGRGASAAAALPTTGSLFDSSDESSGGKR